MLDQNVAVSFEENEIPSYTSGSLYNADDLSTLNQLMRMYPNVLEIVDLDSQTRRYILNRTLHHMLHLDKVFSMETTFDHVHFDKMKVEAIAYMEWLDSPDNTPVPEILKYKVAGSVIEDADEIKPASISTESTVTDQEQPKRERTKRGPSGNSAYQRALAIYNEDVAAGASRASTLERFNKELGIAPNTANVYYSKFKHAVKSK